MEQSVAGCLFLRSFCPSALRVNDVDSSGQKPPHLCFLYSICQALLLSLLGGGAACHTRFLLLLQQISAMHALSIALPGWSLLLVMKCAVSMGTARLACSDVEHGGLSPLLLWQTCCPPPPTPPGPRDHQSRLAPSSVPYLWRGCLSSSTDPVRGAA